VRRRPRAEEPGAIHHVYARGNRAAAIFVDDADRERYLRLLGRTTRLKEWRCLAFCLMSNHVHLLVETPRPNLGAGMQQLHGRYAQGFNERHRVAGHVFQGRYGARKIRDDIHLVTAHRYVEGNPVEAALVARPEDWPWSSARRPGPPWLAVGRLQALLANENG
jgi:putative transposase